MEEPNVELAIEKFRPWFHNLHLPSGAQTAPDHALGDFPANKWRQIEPFIPADLAGWRAIDIGCNAGFYSFELARRGASVTAIDIDEHYLRQARWAAEQCGLQTRIMFRRAQVYELARQPQRYDLVWFMGVSYHLLYPFLALNIARRIVGRMMVFQTLTMPGENMAPTDVDPELDERHGLLADNWPKMAFIERRFAHDPTNWWIPNRSCVEAMLRASGFNVTDRPGDEIFLCEPAQAETSELQRLMEAEFKAAVGIE